MPDLPQFLLFMAATLIPAAVLLIWLEHLGILGSLQDRLEDWLKTRGEQEQVRRIKRGSGPWIPAPVGEEDRGALLLHDIELATNRSLLVSFDKVVYVTYKQRKEISRYLRSSKFERGVAAEVFARHGYQLVTTRK